ncbi:MAG TPA: hypothetical protein VMI11_13360 [Actinomycetes bacterium]|nr:hypothetical protein [Actinomycetes bacterium]
MAYWCEGGKDKPYDRREQVQFTNSDVLVLAAFLAWLDLLEVPRSRRRYHT